MRKYAAACAAACAVAAGVVTVQVLASPNAVSAVAFKPASLAGKWSGTWTNTTFGSTGPIRANVRFTGGKLLPTIQFGGNVFGCADPAPAVFSLSKGGGNNQYNASGFKVKQVTQAFGELTGTYTHRNNAVSGSGKNVACRPGLSWTMTGKLTSGKFSATVSINLPDGTKATAILAAKKL